MTPTPEIKEKAYLQRYGPRKSNMNQVFTTTVELPGIQQPERKNTIDVTKVRQARTDEIPIQGAHFFLINLVSGSHVLQFLIDSGADISMIPAHLANILVPPEEIFDISPHVKSTAVKTTYGLVKMPKFACKISFEIAKTKYSHVFSIIENNSDDFLLLGMDFLSRKPLNLDFYDMALKLRPLVLYGSPTYSA